MKYLPFALLLLIAGCSRPPATTPASTWVRYDQAGEIDNNADNSSRRLRYKLIQSRNTDRAEMLDVATQQLAGFSGGDYERLHPLVFNQDIPTMQEHVAAGRLTYADLTRWYLYRIVSFESNRETYLNALIALNPRAVAEARAMDQERTGSHHPIFGMPVLLKDNVDVAGMPTTAGAHALANNMAEDAFITKRLKANGAIILGKTNLSEWANFLCDGCPNGYSALGGQTLNAYGRKTIDTGGSSSGSGAAMAANYAAAAVGTETSGSILSPSSQSSLVGLKPTVGLLSRSGIVPISSTLDTPGPMTRSVTDNAILLSAMSGADAEDPATVFDLGDKPYWEEVATGSLTGKRFGVIRRFLDNPLYVTALKRVVALGADTVVYDPPEADLTGFLALLNADMREDLPAYLKAHAGPEVKVTDVPTVIAHNSADTTNRIPYGQAVFLGIVAEETRGEAHEELKARLLREGTRYFAEPMAKHRLDAVLSINNYSAGFAAVAHHPALTVPMGYGEGGAPFGLTIIGRPFTENTLLKMAYAFEKSTASRVAPKAFN